MKFFTLQKKSIAFRLTKFIMIVIIIQTLLMIGIIIQGGVIKQGKTNAYNSFHEKVNNRKNFLEREMKNNWTNIDPFVSQISSVLSSDHMDSDAALTALSTDLIDMLRSTQTTGAFVILNEKNELGNHPALYLRDYDPLMNSYSLNDIYMILGPSKLAKELQIPLDQTWTYDLKLTSDNEGFYKKPYDYSSLSIRSEYIGYFNPPFRLTPRDLDIITYSMPLKDLNNNTIGIIGIEITLNYMTKLLPASDLQSKNALGYMVAYRENSQEDLKPIISNGALQKRMISSDQPLELSSVDPNYSIYRLMNSKEKKTIYGSLESFGLYQQNTPFVEESWILIGWVPESYLLSYVNDIQGVLLISLVIAIVLGILSSSFFSYQFAKPIRSLANKVRNSNGEGHFSISETGVLEVDELARAMVDSNKALLDAKTRLSKVIELFEVPIGAFELKKDSETVFATDLLMSLFNLDDETGKKFLQKKSFMTLLDNIFSQLEAHEKDVYQVSADPPKWVKINMTKNEESVVGIVIDCTEDMKEKLAIKKDRDLDPLTKILNRKAFQYRFDSWYEKDNSGVAALVMFDLDNLKRINDAYGHKWGDTYILKAVQLLKEITVDEKMLLARRSGDEFVVLLYNFKDKDAIRKTMNDFYTKIESKKFEFPDLAFKRIEISGGLMWLDYPHMTYDELLHFADEALYEAKYNNKGSWIENKML